MKPKDMKVKGGEPEKGRTFGRRDIMRDLQRITAAVAVSALLDISGCGVGQLQRPAKPDDKAVEVKKDGEEKNKCLDSDEGPFVKKFKWDLAPSESGTTYILREEGSGNVMLELNKNEIIYEMSYKKMQDEAFFFEKGHFGSLGTHDSSETVAGVLKKLGKLIPKYSQRENGLFLQRTLVRLLCLREAEYYNFPEKYAEDFEKKFDMDAAMAEALTLVENLDPDSLLFFLDAVSEAYAVSWVVSDWCAEEGEKYCDKTEVDRYWTFAQHMFKEVMVKASEREDFYTDSRILSKVQTMWVTSTIPIFSFPMIHFGYPRGMIHDGINHLKFPNELGAEKKSRELFARFLLDSAIINKGLAEGYTKMPEAFLLQHPMLRPLTMYVTGSFAMSKLSKLQNDEFSVWYIKKTKKELAKEESEGKAVAYERLKFLLEQLYESSTADLEYILPKIIADGNYELASKIMIYLAEDHDSTIKRCEEGVTAGDFISAAYAQGSSGMKELIIKMLDESHQYDFDISEGKPLSKENFTLMLLHSDKEQAKKVAGMVGGNKNIELTEILIEAFGNAPDDKKTVLIDLLGEGNVPEFYIAKKVFDGLSYEQKAHLLNVLIAKYSGLEGGLEAGNKSSFINWLKSYPKNNERWELVPQYNRILVARQFAKFVDEEDIPPAFFSQAPEAFVNEELQEAFEPIASKTFGKIEEELKKKGMFVPKEGEKRQNLEFASLFLTADEIATCYKKFNIEYWKRYSPQVLLQLPKVAEGKLNKDKVALVVMAKSDWNDAFYQEAKLYAELIDMEYSVVVFETALEKEAFGFMGKFRDAYAPASLLILAGHGSYTTLTLGLGTNAEIDTNDKKKLLKVVENNPVSEDGVVLLFSCDTGLGDDSLANMISGVFDRKVFAPSDSTVVDDWVINEKTNRVIGVKYKCSDCTEKFEPE